MGIMDYGSTCRTAARPGYYQITRGLLTACTLQQEMVGWATSPSYAQQKCSVSVVFVSGAFWDVGTTPTGSDGGNHGSDDCYYVFGLGARVANGHDSRPNSDWQTAGDAVTFSSGQEDAQLVLTSRCKTYCEPGFAQTTIGYTADCSQTTAVDWAVDPVCTVITCTLPDLPIGARFVGVDWGSGHEDNFKDMLPNSNTDRKDPGQTGQHTRYTTFWDGQVAGHRRRSRNAFEGWWAQCMRDKGFTYNHDIDQKQNPPFPTMCYETGTAMKFFKTRAGWPTGKHSDTQPSSAVAEVPSGDRRKRGVWTKRWARTFSNTANNDCAEITDVIIGCPRKQAGFSEQC